MAAIHMIIEMIEKQLFYSEKETLISAFSVTDEQS